MNLYACVSVCVCVSACTCVCIRDLPWQGYIITDQCLCCLASWLIHPFPLDRASLDCPTSSSLACYHDNTILPPQSPQYRPVPIRTLILRQPTLPVSPVTDFIWAWPKSLKISYLIQHWRKKCVCLLTHSYSHRGHKSVPKVILWGLPLICG